MLTWYEENTCSLLIKSVYLDSLIRAKQSENILDSLNQAAIKATAQRLKRRQRATQQHGIRTLPKQQNNEATNIASKKFINLIPLFKNHKQ